MVIRHEIQTHLSVLVAYWKEDQSVLIASCQKH